MGQAATDIVSGHHIAPGIENAAVLAIEINQLGKGQPVNGLAVVVKVTVIPDVLIIGAGG